MARDPVIGEVNVPSPTVSGDPSSLITIEITHPIPLHVAVADRAHVGQMGDEWAEAGVYLLLERPGQAGDTWTCYVGKSAASGGLKDRLAAHLQNPGKSSWYRALAIRPIEPGWNEAEVTWLEGQIHRFLDESTGVSLSNTQVPGSGRLKESHQIPLRGVEPALRGVLALIGHHVGVSRARQEPPPKPPRSPSRRGMLADLVKAGLLGVGATLIAVDPRWPGAATVTADGGIRVGDMTYMSPSPAAQALSRRKAESGWTFWAVGSVQGPTLENLRARLESGQKAEPTAPPPAARLGTYADAAAEVAQGRTSLLGQMVASGLIPADARLTSTTKKWPAEGRLRGDGRIETASGTFDSPSAAGSAITGGSVNGWRFWAVDSPEGDTLAAIRDRFRRREKAG